MKKILTILLALLTGCCVAAAASAVTARASEQSNVDIGELLGDAKDKLSEAVADLDNETVKEIFSFVQEKIRDGSLKTENGLEDAIREGEDRFGVTINEEDAKKVVDVMEKLESMGFSGEYVIEKAEELYDEYGADFVDHANEVVADTLQEAVTNAAEGFFSNLWESTKNFFKNLFGGL